MSPLSRRTLALALVAGLAAAQTGCITRAIRETIYEDSQTQIVLRHEKRGSSVIERGYSHPTAIAPVRLAHVLSRIDVRVDAEKGPQRMPAIPTEGLYVVADHLAKALRRADRNQEVAVYYIRRAKRWGIFDRRYLTTFVAYVREDRLFIHLSRTDWEIPKSGRTERLPAPHVGDYSMKFRVVVSPGMKAVDGQSVAVAWRDPVFKKPTRTRMSPGGKVVRRTILMESLESGETSAEPSEFERLPENLSSATLRALADLEDERHRGDVDEAEYIERRRQIIRSDPASR